ncbi:MAG: TIGR02300 family protein [Pseudolabrys sp.]
MAKPELGTKRICPDTGRKFYDMGKSPVISPYTGKVVPIILPPQSRGRPADAARNVPAAAVEAVVPETVDAEFVSLEDADAEQRGKVKKKGEVAAEEEEIEGDDESLDDAAFIEEQEEGDDDVADIIGDGIEKEEEQ